MKRLLLLVILASSVAIILAQEERKIVILHTNDLHSRLYGYSPESAYSPLIPGNDKTVGGFARIASVLKSENGMNSDITLTIDAGDFLMGTLFHALEPKTGFQLRLMKKMGYDLVCLGNHEFDFGPEVLAAIIEKSAEQEEIPAILAGNIVFSTRDTGDDKLEKLFATGKIFRSMIIEKSGLKIGIFSILGKDAVDVAPLARPVTFSKQISTAGIIVKDLKKEGCDLIICVSHSGVSKNKKGQWEGEDVDLAKSVKGIDVIISGHTHTRLESPLIINGIPIVQTGEYGQNVGKLVLSWKSGKLGFEDYKLIPVDDSIIGDVNIEALIDRQQKIITMDILDPIGVGYFDPVAETDFMLECNEQGDFKFSNLGPMVADAIHYYINKHSVEGCDMSMVATGIIRDRIVQGPMSAPDIFRVMSLGSGNDEVPGYPLARLYVTGKELKNILEILQVAYKSSPSNYCFYSGMKAEFDPGRGLLRKISRIEIKGKNGSIKEVDFSKKNKTLYSVTANSYMLEFISIIRKKSMGLIRVIPKDVDGQPVTDIRKAVIDMNDSIPGIQEGKEWIALLEFIMSMRDSDNDGLPDIDRKYMLPVRTFIDVKR